MWWNSGKVLVEQWDSDSGIVEVEQCGGTVWWNSVVEQCWWNSDGGTMWSKRRTVLVEQCCGTVRWNSVGGTVLVEQWNSNGGSPW